MKAIFFVLFAVALSVNLRNSEFTSFMSQYGKSYAAPEEARYRLRVFNDNLKKIEEHNAKNLPWTLGVNKFADVSAEEFAYKFCGCAKDPKTRGNRQVTLVGDVPARVDWREKGAVTPVKNQASCGSCWAFSATGSMEGRNFIANGKLVSLSEQQLVDCDHQSAGCGGGLMTTAFEYAMKKGMCTEEEYPYHAMDEDCKDDKCTPVVFPKGYEEVPMLDGAALKQAVSQGPVSVAVEADSIVFQLYTGGVIDSTACGTSLNHGVLAVGYAKEYIIVKNSWGAAWGDKGYIKIAHRDQGEGICGINMNASYPTF